MTDSSAPSKDRNANITAMAKPNGSSSPSSTSPPAIVDATFSPCWFKEPRAPADYSSSRYLTLTPSGLEAIATHKYRPGEYTHLDDLLNPFWTRLTEMLPMWLAPNMVTSLGGVHCFIAYMVLWWHAPDYDSSVPDWVVALSAYCTAAYYTLDCMDGKQARRTGTSSPLGQLL